MEARQRQFSLWYLAFTFLAILAIQSYLTPHVESLSYSSFKALLRAGKIEDVALTETRITGTLLNEGLDELLPPEELEPLRTFEPGPHPFATVRVSDPDLVPQLEAANVRFSGRIDSKLAQGGAPVLPSPRREPPLSIVPSGSRAVTPRGARPVLEPVEREVHLVRAGPAGLGAATRSAVADAGPSFTSASRASVSASTETSRGSRAGPAVAMPWRTCARWHSPSSACPSRRSRPWSSGPAGAVRSGSRPVDRCSTSFDAVQRTTGWTLHSWKPPWRQAPRSASARTHPSFRREASSPEDPTPPT